MTIGTKLFWKGDFSNEARSGVISAIKGEMVTIEWSNGGRMVVPAFTITPTRWIIG